MRRWWIALTALVLMAAPRVTHPSIAALEKSFDRRLERDVLEGDAMQLLGMTRGVYIDGFGIVYSAEVNLAPITGISPFHPELTKDDLARTRERKLKRIPVLKQAMRSMLVDSAASLDAMPGEEQVVIGVSLTRHPRENIAGIPSQIVMQAQKRVLLDFQTGKRDRAQLETAVRMTEF